MKKTDVKQDGEEISEQTDGLGTSSQNPETEATEESKEDAGYLIANIFGESDEEEEFVGFDDEDLLPDKPEESEVKVDKKEKSSKEEESSDDDVEIPARDFVSDFDLMLQKRKEMNRMKRRSKKDVDIINDNDDIIAAMLTQMKEAVEEDRIANQRGKAATKKLKMLPTIVQHLKKPRKPGDKGWIGRARVPMPSHRDYVNRPQSKVETYDVSKNSKKVLSRYEKQLRKLKEKSSMTNGNRKAVGVSVNGTKLSL